MIVLGLVFDSKDYGGNRKFKKFFMSYLLNFSNRCAFCNLEKIKSLKVQYNYVQLDNESHEHCTCDKIKYPANCEVNNPEENIFVVRSILN